MLNYDNVKQRRFENVEQQNLRFGTVKFNVNVRSKRRNPTFENGKPRDSQMSLQFHFRRGHNTISTIVHEVCLAIYSALKDDFLKVPSTRAEWKQIAQKYEDLWQFPDCVGALDGKHVAPMPPHDSGAQFRNYKGFFSIVLMALVDAELNFVFVDVGRNGRMNDSGIWGACKLKEALEKEPSILPDAQVLPRSTQAAPYVIVGDEGFGLKPYLMRPHPAAELTTEKRLFNYRLSRARRTSENAFGVLANRWQIYRSPLRHDPKRATDIVLATVALHNFLRSKRTTRQLYTPSDSLDVEDILTGNVRNGSWRQGVSPAGAMRQFRRGGSNCSDYAKAVRNLYTNYFVNEGQAAGLIFQPKACGVHYVAAVQVSPRTITSPSAAAQSRTAAAEADYLGSCLRVWRYGPYCCIYELPPVSDARKVTEKKAAADARRREEAAQKAADAALFDDQSKCFQLLKLVQNYPWLYGKLRRDDKDNPKRENVSEEIARLFDIVRSSKPSTACQQPDFCGAGPAR
ncbi:protein ALP1-like [Ixodes scapularis]